MRYRKSLDTKSAVRIELFARQHRSSLTESEARPLASLDGVRSFGSVRDLIVPNELPVSSGNAGNELVTVAFTNSLLQHNLPAELSRTAMTTTSTCRVVPARHNRGRGHHHHGNGKGHGHDCDGRHGHGHGHDHDCPGDGEPGVVVCGYRGGSPQAHPSNAAELALAAQYEFVSCDNGAKPGDVVTSDGVSVHIEDGDTNQPNISVRVPIREKPTEEVAPACERVELLAVAPLGVAPVTGQVDLGEARRFSLPATLAQTLNGGCAPTLSLAFRPDRLAPWTTCDYELGEGQYALHRCDRGSSTAGTMFEAREIRLSHAGALQSCTGTDVAQVTLSESTPCGDLGPTHFVDREGAIFSSLRGELYVIGNDLSYGDPDAYVYGLAKGRWQHIRLDDSIANVIAATFDAQQNMLYFVDYPFGLGVRLGRWDVLTNHIEWLGKLADGWSDERAWLIQSLDGRLIFASSPADYASKSKVSVLRWEGGSLSPRIARIAGKIFGKPLADAEGISLDLATGPNFEHVRQARIPYSRCQRGGF